MEKKDIRKFCENFAYNFISSECMLKEFANLTCADAQEVRTHLQFTLDMDLHDFLEKQGLISEE